MYFIEQWKHELACDAFYFFQYFLFRIKLMPLYISVRIWIISHPEYMHSKQGICFNDGEDDILATKKRGFSLQKH